MFGMGFMEIVLIIMIAIVVLGPEKLPSTILSIVKFFRKFTTVVEQTKSTLDKELNISEIRKETIKFKSQFEKATKANLNKELNISKIKNETIKFKSQIKDVTKDISVSNNIKDKN